MVGAVEFADAFDGEEVGADALNAGTHAHEHTAELLEVGFAGGVVDGGGAMGGDGCHDDVGGSGDGGFVEEHIAA